MPNTAGHTDTTSCRNGDHCAGYNPAGRTPAPATCGPICQPCLDRHTRDLRALLYDWLDLEQLHYPTLAQALTGQPGGTSDPPMPINGAAEALQAEIAWALATWEAEIRTAQRLHQPPAGGRQGRAVHRAVHLLAQHTRALAQLGHRTVQPAGVEDPLRQMDGADALTHYTALHQRARAMLGRTRPRFWVPGECWQKACAEAHRVAVERDGHNADEWLWRSAPAHLGDEPPVHCRYCDQPRTYDDYERYVRLLVWPALHPGDAA